MLYHYFLRILYINYYYIMSRFNTSTNHPLIPNSQQYMFEKQYISIDSEDRNILKYPRSSEFEIELPQDYCNVQSVRLSNWTFPLIYNTFSYIKENITITFKITNPYNPGAYGVADPYLDILFQALYANVQTEYVCVIEEGNYSVEHMSTELTRRFNITVSDVIREYLTINAPGFLTQFDTDKGYNQFVIVYNTVSQKLWFGNKSSEFIITNSSSIYENITDNLKCVNKSLLPEYTNWGLPFYLGFSRTDATTVSSSTLLEPRFFYGDVVVGDNGYWLKPDAAYIGASVYYLEAPERLNIKGDNYFYMEIDGLNNIDETIPYSTTYSTTHSNETNGVVKSAFAKIGIISGVYPFQPWNSDNANTMKIYNPPAERIRKLKIRIRYHNGQLVDFGQFDYSIMLELTMFRPQNLKDYKMYIPETIANFYN